MTAIDKQKTVRNVYQKSVDKNLIKTMRNRSRKSSVSHVPVQDLSIESRRWSIRFFSSISNMKHRKLTTLGILSLIILVLLAINVNYRKNFAPKSGNKKINLFPPNPEEPLPPSSSILHLFKNAAINSDSEECSLIGRTMLQRNGNVVDSIISVMFCLGLTSMQSMGLGGGFLMNLFIRKDGKAYTINARERAPILATNESYYAHRFQNNKANSNKMYTGPLSIAIPGEVLGYWELHKKFSLMKWKDLIQPTIDLCEKGFILSKHMVDSFRLHDSFKENNSFREMFLNANAGWSPRRTGSIVKPPPNLCSTYRLLAKNGGYDFYTGELAKLIISDLNDIGSIISKYDLESYRIQINESIPIKLNNENTLFVTPPPSSGLMVAFALNIIKKCNLTTANEDKSINYHRLIEVLKFAFAQRPQLSDPLFHDMELLISYLKSTETAHGICKLINDEQTSPYEYYNPSFSIERNFGTSHISIIAPNGDAVSVTSSINYYFGSGLVGARSGIIFNSGMDDFSYPQESNYFDLPPSPLNYLQPLKQASTSMTPIIVTDRLGPKIVIGAAGGVKIISAVLLALIRILWFGDDLKKAVDTPRIHHQLLPMVLEYEYGNEQYLIDELEKRGHITERYSNRGSIINALYQNESGIYGVADYRKQGEVIGY